MAKTIHVVVPDRVSDNGRVSYRFRVLSGLPQELSRAYPLYGILRREEKGPNELNPWKFVRGEQGAIGPDGFQKWTVYLFNSGGQHLFASVDEDKEEEAGLQGLLSGEDMPDCILLVDLGTFGTLERVCRLAGVELVAHRYEGELPTA